MICYLFCLLSVVTKMERLREVWEPNHEKESSHGNAASFASNSACELHWITLLTSSFVSDCLIPMSPKAVIAWIPKDPPSVPPTGIPMERNHPSWNMPCAAWNVHIWPWPKESGFFEPSEKDCHHPAGPPCHVNDCLIKHQNVVKKQHQALNIIEENNLMEEHLANAALVIQLSGQCKHNGHQASHCNHHLDTSAVMGIGSKLSQPCCHFCSIVIKIESYWINGLHNDAYTVGQQWSTSAFWLSTVTRCNK